MVTIISKQDGPRKGEAELKHTIKQNRGTIEQLANTLSGAIGGRSGQQRVAPPPQASTTTHSFRKTSSEGEARPYVRVSLNGRVVLVDYETGNQLHYLGEVRGKGAAARFRLATKDNGFYAPLEAELCERLRAIDGAPVIDAAAEDRLKKAIEERLALGG